jgi:hypothetical protein
MLSRPFEGIGDPVLHSVKLGNVVGLIHTWQRTLEAKCVLPTAEKEEATSELVD